MNGLTDFKVGDRVACPNADELFVTATANYLRGRVGEVICVYPAKRTDKTYCGPVGVIEIRWLKRGGRGKEKVMRMNPRDVEVFP